MALFVKVRNINPLGPVLTVLDGEARTVAAGEVVEVTPEQAGAGPRWREVVAGEVVEPHQALRASQPDGVLDEVYDLGSGLLAQFTNWELVTEEND